MSDPQPSSPVDAYAQAAEVGVFPLALDTPFAVGTVNTYLIEDEPLTLIDCGPNTATALTQLEGLLGARGHDITDLELIVITHQHSDHAGLADAIARRSRAELACIDVLAPVMGKWYEHAAAADDYARELMLQHGVEPHVAEALRAVANVTRGFSAPAQIDRVLRPGSQLRFRNRAMTIHHLPGHSPSDTVLHDESNGIAYLGDHLLARLSPNALLTLPLRGEASTRPEPLLEYRQSLLQTRGLEFALGLTGHGVPICNHATLIDERLDAQQARAEQFYDLLAHGPRSAHELAGMRWGRVAVTQAFLTLSEVLGHLGLLIAAGRIQENASGDVNRFERVS